MKFIMLLICCVSASVQAQSLLQNGTFDQNINPWTGPSTSPSWVSNDGANASGHGSIQFGGNNNNNGSYLIQSELFPAKFNYTYIMAASYKRPNDSVADGMGMSVVWYDENENYIGEYPWDQYFDVSTADVWTDYDYVFQNIYLSDAAFARVYLWVHTPASGTEQSYGLYDDVILFQDTVFYSNFD